MINKKINSKVFIKNRKNLSLILPDSFLVILTSPNIPFQSSDSQTKFIQDSDIFYFSGINQEDTSLILYKTPDNIKLKEVLFIKKSSDLERTWDGEKLSKDRAYEISGIKNIMWNTKFKETIKELSYKQKNIFLSYNENSRIKSPINQSKISNLRINLQKHYPNHNYKRSSRLFSKLRCIKSEEEIKLIKRACDITKLGYEKVLPIIKPGLFEYQVEAEFIKTFILEGSSGFAYEPIIASGSNNNTLHYLQNNNKCKEGELLLMDVAAKYCNYNSDVTRTVPISGRFTKKQRDVYLSVLKILRYCISTLITPNKSMYTYREEVGELMEEELIKLKLLKSDIVYKERKENVPHNNRSYRKYFMHGVSHSLGIDVHDVGLDTLNCKFKENMCLTVEPGIYISEYNFGIRLENNIIIKEKKNIDLTENIPLDPNEIESIMLSKK